MDKDILILFKGLIVAHIISTTIQILSSQEETVVEALIINIFYSVFCTGLFFIQEALKNKKAKENNKDN